MILINLLPPELRRARRTGVNPLMVAGVIGLVVVLSTVSLWWWVEYVRLQKAYDKLEEAKVQLTEATARADSVRELQKKIADNEKLHATIT